jgi:hypothetical protein
MKSIALAKSRVGRSVVVISTLVFLAIGIGGAFAQYSVTDLGQMQVQAMNNSGQVVGLGSGNQVCLYSGGSWTGLGVVGFLGMRTIPTASINDNGQVVCCSETGNGGLGYSLYN